MKQFEPVIIQKTGEEVEKLHLFSVVDEDGEEEKFYVPSKVGYNMTLAILDVAASAGDLAANVFALKQVLGEDGYDALLDCDELTDEQFEEIMDHVQELSLGKNKGKLNRASRRALMKSRG